MLDEARRLKLLEHRGKISLTLWEKDFLETVIQILTDGRTISGPQGDTLRTLASKHLPEDTPIVEARSERLRALRSLAREGWTIERPGVRLIDIGILYEDEKGGVRLFQDMSEMELLEVERDVRRAGEPTYEWRDRALPEPGSQG